jgi:hypothetical protein
MSWRGGMWHDEHHNSALKSSIILDSNATDQERSCIIERSMGMENPVCECATVNSRVLKLPHFLGRVAQPFSCVGYRNATISM